MRGWGWLPADGDGEDQRSLIPKVYHLSQSFLWREDSCSYRADNQWTWSDDTLGTYSSRDFQPVNTAFPFSIICNRSMWLKIYTPPKYLTTCKIQHWWPLSMYDLRCILLLCFRLWLPWNGMLGTFRFRGRLLIWYFQSTSNVFNFQRFIRLCQWIRPVSRSRLASDRQWLPMIMFC